MNNIQAVCAWYGRQCSEEWQEEYGISINTLDNPGWSVKIDLTRTELEDRFLATNKVNRSEYDWIHIRRNGAVFEGFGGVMNLDEIFKKFLEWTEQGEDQKPL